MGNTPHLLLLLTSVFQHGEEFPPGRDKGDWFRREQEEEEHQEEDREERKETFSVSSSSSVSKVSVKIGGVSVSGNKRGRGQGGRALWGQEQEVRARGQEQEVQEVPLWADRDTLPILQEARVRQSFFQRLLSK